MTLHNLRYINSGDKKRSHLYLIFNRYALIGFMRYKSVIIYEFISIFIHSKKAFILPPLHIFLIFTCTCV